MLAAPRGGNATGELLRPRNVELAACSGDRLLERLGAIRRPVVRVARSVHVPVGCLVARLVEGEVTCKVGAAQNASLNPARSCRDLLPPSGFPSWARPTLPRVAGGT